MDTTTDSSPPATPKPPPVVYDSDDSFCSIDEMIAEARASLNSSRSHDNFHPVRFTWKEIIHPNSNIRSPDIIAQPSNEDTTTQHPFIQKLAHFLSTAQKRYAENLTVKTSLSNVVLSLPDLLTHWSINETKRHFTYLTTDDTVRMTFWLGLPSPITYSQFKRTNMRYLQREKTWIELHPMSMTHIETTLIGWYCETHHPDATNLRFLASKLNCQLKRHLRENKTDLVTFARRYATLHTWKGDTIPSIVLKTVTPKWRTRGKTFTMTAIVVIVPKSYRALLWKMIQDIDLTMNSGRVTFVDMSMSYTGSPLHAEYGKALFKHHQYTCDHFVERLSGLSRDDMTNFPLLKIPGVISLHTTDRTIKSGSWRLVTTNDPLVAPRIDSYIHKHYLTVSYDSPPNRLSKPSESVTEATKQAWISQTKDFTATAPPRKNAWFQTPKIINSKPTQKTDDRSASTLNTTSSHRDNIDEIARLVRTLQETELENKKMRDAFTRSLQTQSKLQNDIALLKTSTPAPITHTDSVFKKFQSKLDAKLQAFAQKTTATLDQFHQKLEDHKASATTITNHLDTRMSQIKNSTNMMFDGLTAKLEAFTYDQSEKLDILASTHQTNFDGFGSLIDKLNHNQQQDQQNNNERFDSILLLLQQIQSNQQTASKRTRSPTTDLDLLPDYKKPASTRPSSDNLDMDTSPSSPDSAPPDPPDRK